MIGVREKLRPRGSAPPVVGAEESLQELAELARSAGARVEQIIVQTREKLDPATLVGRGKLEEIRREIAARDANLLLFDFDLSPTQQRNIEEATGCRVVNRTQVILDIFARHARTREGQLQVELAQLNYLLPRLAGRGVEMSRLGGGIGTRGPGETQLEMDRRRIRRRIALLERNLGNVREQRLRRRARRAGVPIATLALVGYTNAGKSTLFNRLTGSQVLTSAQMFATLDPTLRALELPSRRRVLVSDTVGFIRNLPHTLIRAFRATLEEVCEANLLLLVSDCSSPLRAQQDEEVRKVLQEIGALDKPILEVWNQVDRLSPDERSVLPPHPDRLFLSAATGEGLEALLQKIDQRLEVDSVERVQLRFLPSQGRELSWIYQFGRVLNREERDGYVLVDAELPHSIATRVQQFQTRPPLKAS